MKKKSKKKRSKKKKTIKKRGRGRPKKYVTKDDFICKHCNKKFDEYQQLKNCLRAHFNKNCPICGKLFQRKESYKDHMQRHNKHKTHFCRGCKFGPMYRSTKYYHEARCSKWTNLSEEEKELRRGKPGRPKKAKKKKKNKKKGTK